MNATTRLGGGNHGDRKVISWEEPATTRNAGRFDPDEVLEALRERPGEWAAILGTEDVSDSYATNSTLVARLREEGIEVRQSTKDGVRKIYARYPGRGSRRR